MSDAKKVGLFSALNLIGQGLISNAIDAFLTSHTLIISVNIFTLIISAMIEGYLVRYYNKKK